MPQGGGSASFTIPPGWTQTTYTKADITSAVGSPAWLTANSPVSMFTVTGLVLCYLVGRVTTKPTSTANTGTVAIGYKANGAATLNASAFAAATTMDGTNAPTNSVWSASNFTRAGGVIPDALTAGTWTILNGADVIATIATNNMTAGGVEFHMLWMPISPGATVVATSLA